MAGDQQHATSEGSRRPWPVSGLRSAPGLVS